MECNTSSQDNELHMWDIHHTEKCNSGCIRRPVFSRDEEAAVSPDRAFTTSLEHCIQTKVLIFNTYCFQHILWMDAQTWQSQRTSLGKQFVTSRKKKDRILYKKSYSKTSLKSEDKWSCWHKRTKLHWVSIRTCNVGTCHGLSKQCKQNP